MPKKKIFISGSISNNLNTYKENFAHAETQLIEGGYIVLNPSILPLGMTQPEYMSICIPMLYACDEIFMLKGWQYSVGAAIEHKLATQAGKVIRYEE